MAFSVGQHVRLSTWGKGRVERGFPMDSCFVVEHCGHMNIVVRDGAGKVLSFMWEESLEAVEGPW